MTLQRKIFDTLIGVALLPAFVAIGLWWRWERARMPANLKTIDDFWAQESEGRYGAHL